MSSRENNPQSRQTQQLEALGRLADQAMDLDESIAAQVKQLRRANVSWTAIAQMLGVTRQAAQQRYGRDSESIKYVSPDLLRAEALSSGWPE